MRSLQTCTKFIGDVRSRGARFSRVHPAAGPNSHSRMADASSLLHATRSSESPRRSELNRDSVEGQYRRMEPLDLRVMVAVRATPSVPDGLTPMPVWSP